MTISLLDLGLPQPVAARAQSAAQDALALNPGLHQWFTPRWVCEAIIERHYPDLDMADLVLEPSCGAGHFLQALPAEVNAIGVEIDPRLAQLARYTTGRQVIAGDFLTAQVPGQVTHVIGNPPFDSRMIHAFLDRAHLLLQDGGSCGFLLPAYVFQTSSKVLAMNQKWSISQELMPRNIFPNLSLPLCFAMFRKDRVRSLVGFFLYREAADVANLPNDVKAALAGTETGSVWRRAVRAAFARLGVGTATLDALYAAVERPSENRFWREKVRQVLNRYPEFRRTCAKTYSIQGELCPA